MAFPDRRTANILLTILLFAVVLAIAYAARGVIVIFAFAILFAYLIDPVVRFLQRHSLFFKNLIVTPPLTKHSESRLGDPGLVLPKMLDAPLLSPSYRESKAAGRKRAAYIRS